MARSQIPIAVISRAGVAAAAAVIGDPSNNHYFANDGRTILQMQQINSGSGVVTFEIPETVDGIPNQNRVIVIPAGSTLWAGPWPTAAYNQADGTVYVDPAGTSVTFHAYKI